MSTVTEKPAQQERTGIPFGRLVSVEIRKMFDTRGGRWLLIITGGMVVVALGLSLLITALVDDATITAAGFAETVMIVLSILLPVIAITAVTSEWGQRTNLVTFTLEPHRGKVFAAKFAAVILLALSTIVLAIVLGALANVAYGPITGNEVVWNLDLSDLLWNIGLQLLYFTMAFAFGMVFLNTPAAVALFYVIALLLPMMVYSTLMVIFEWAESFFPWIDVNIAAAPIVTGQDFLGQTVDVSAENYAQLAVSVFIWIVIPLVAGASRVLKSEVK